MKWEQLDKQQLADFVAAVKTTGEAVLFNLPTSDGKRVPLPFYNNVSLYRLTSFASIPVFTLHFLNDGHRFHYLDGSEIALLTVNQTGDLHLNSGNIISYLNFYFFSVTRMEGEVFLVQDPETYPFQDNNTFEIGGGTVIGQQHNYEITEESDSGFLVETPLFMDGTLVRAKLRVDPTGRVHILDQRVMMRHVPVATGAGDYAD